MNSSKSFFACSAEFGGFILEKCRVPGVLYGHRTVKTSLSLAQPILDFINDGARVSLNQGFTGFVIDGQGAKIAVNGTRAIKSETFKIGRAHV
jgi:hypothetical protein